MVVPLAPIWAADAHHALFSNTAGINDGSLCRNVRSSVVPLILQAAACTAVHYIAVIKQNSNKGISMWLKAVGGKRKNKYFYIRPIAAVLVAYHFIFING